MGPWLAMDRASAEAIKGLALGLMLAHHLFGLPLLIEPPNFYWPLIPGVPLEYWLGRFGKICVGLFLFVSGYGFAVRMRAGGAPGWGWFAARGGRFLLAYWPYFLLALTIGALFFQERLPSGSLRFPVDPAGIVLNALTLRNNLAYEWWFAETYLVLVLLARPLLLASGRPLALLAGALLAFLAGAALDVARIDPTDLSFANLLIWQLPFVCGILGAQGKAGPLARLAARWTTPRWAAAAAALGLLAGFALVERWAGAAMTPYLILATPLFLLVVGTPSGGVRLWAPAVWRWLGRYTLGLWLVHPFFCYYFFQDEIFAPRWSPLVFAALLGASLAVVVPVEWLRRSLLRALAREKQTA